MLPKFSGVPTITDTFANPQPQTSDTYRLQWEQNRVAGQTAELAAVQQAMEKVLLSQRYQYVIYSWNYGVELFDLIGMSTKQAIPEIQRRITEALTQDDRIRSVDAFSFETKRGRVTVSFTVHTVFGEMQGQKEVQV